MTALPLPSSSFQGRALKRVFGPFFLPMWLTLFDCATTLPIATRSSNDHFRIFESHLLGNRLYYYRAITTIKEKMWVWHGESWDYLKSSCGRYRRGVRQRRAEEEEGRCRVEGPQWKREREIMLFIGKPIGRSKMIPNILHFIFFHSFVDPT